MFDCCLIKIFKYPEGSLIINSMNSVMDIQLNFRGRLLDTMRVKIWKIVLGAWNKLKARLKVWRRLWFKIMNDKFEDWRDFFVIFKLD